VRSDEFAVTLHAEALRLGFTDCGIARTEALEAEAEDFCEWLKQGRHGTMDYMAEYQAVRADPRLLFEGAKMMITVLKNYDPGPNRAAPALPAKVSTYAWGRDYHHVLRGQLRQLHKWVKAYTGQNVKGQAYVDGAPIMEKVWAKRAGLGWIGKHTNLIHPRRGSWFFIATLVLDLELDYSAVSLPVIADHCGTCTRCLDACPTEALSPYQIDATKCISYLTIELKEATPPELRTKLDGWAYGCDICQQVCPWNRFSEPHNEPAFEPLKVWELLSAEALQDVSGRQFRKLTEDAAIHRIYRNKWLDNLTAAAESQSD
jgi:epoxyqueuosine reductase